LELRRPKQRGLRERPGAKGQVYETEWDGLRIVIEERPEHFQVFIYDPGECEVLYTPSELALTLPTSQPSIS
jgi:hypothetical protein